MEQVDDLFPRYFLSGIELKERLNIALSKIHYDIDINKNTLEIGQKDTKILLKNIDFCFDKLSSKGKEWNLNNVTVSISLNQNTALIGHNGSGKQLY